MNLIRDARKGNYEDAFSNALGSKIFDISFAQLVNTFGIVLIFITGKQFTTIKALALALLYIGFLVFSYYEIILNINFLNPDTPENLMDYLRLN